MQRKLWLWCVHTFMIKGMRTTQYVHSLSSCLMEFGFLQLQLFPQHACLQLLPALCLHAPQLRSVGQLLASEKYVNFFQSNGGWNCCQHIYQYQLMKYNKAILVSIYVGQMAQYTCKSFHVHANGTGPQWWHNCMSVYSCIQNNTSHLQNYVWH